MSYRDDYRDGQREFFWTLPRAFMATLTVAVAVFLLLVLITPLTIGFGWIKGEANLRSFGATRTTYAEAYDDTAALEATVQSICVARKGVADAKALGDDFATQQRETQLIVYETSFNSQRGRYDAYMDDHFRGGVNRPKNLPLPYPTLDEKIAEVC